MPQSPENDEYRIVGASSFTDTGTRVIKHGDTFAVLDPHGDISQVITNEQGIYHEGMRCLSRFDLNVNGERLLLLSSNVPKDTVLLTVDLTNPDLSNGVPYGSLHVFRSKFLWRGACFERFRITNHGSKAAQLTLNLAFAADFVDLFEVRGTRRTVRGQTLPPEIRRSEVWLAYRGVDEVTRTTRLRFAPEPRDLTASSATFELYLEPKQTKHLYVTTAFEANGEPGRATPSFDAAQGQATAALALLSTQDCLIHSTHAQFNEWISRAVADLRLLLVTTPEGRYPHAGIPWFSAPFGRDGIITALESLWVSPELARGVLAYLAAHQADCEDLARDAQPGKILHETRLGEMARLKEHPFGRYYGSADATPLFVMLAGEYFVSTHDLDFVQRLWPHIESALTWIDRHGDIDGDGFVEYLQASKHGLRNQGWKDSHDSVFHSDGAPAEGPIALCEVQAYVYAAKRAAASLADRLGLGRRAIELISQADTLRERFDDAFWCEDLGTYALALDGSKHPCRVRTSNAGHCLFTGIAFPERARTLSEQLFGEDMFSGWGIRTLSAKETRYNPIAYHNGSVWPHDNAIIAEGLSRYGFQEQVLRILQGMFDAGLFLDLQRLPELFCGFPRRPGEGPTRYPTACAPQAWAAAAPLLLLKAALGLRIEAGSRRVLLQRAALPRWLKRVRLTSLRVGSGSVDLEFHRYAEDVGLNVLGRTGAVEVITVR